MRKPNLLPGLTRKTSLRNAGWRGLFLGALALGACSSPQAETAEEITPGLPVSQFEGPAAASAARAEAQPELVLSGEIAADADHTARVFPRVGGEVLRVGVDLGDEVRAGQVLAVLKSSEIAEFQNQHTAATADLAVATKNLAVAEELHQAGLSAAQDVYKARKEMQRAAGTATKSRRLLGTYGVAPGATYRLTAPLAGYIMEKKLSPGMRFNAADLQAAFTVANLDQVWVLANVFESDMGRVHEGQAVEITTLSYPDAPVRGRIDRVYHVLDHESKTMTVRCVLANPGHLLKPGMHAQVRVLPEAVANADASPAAIL
ncbi:efflux RND transporter periplasmic adaptor subunit [Hymenobacter convexus]|uniref:efflux RND transporter periplasmic adaptor subunit n=1 Tax=Hymenobacter sp. CA1UV-4 TaxID=3063782 RepID=UPI0027141932|nr:efflux RND transporter periplasmic adaptor subunit [Hymenobacter sp. CA1UV-4]MDO7852759.1 efflux RND transporter periplasmic adaptor subunit [Hymenobacter sp. CA1UV-4]